MRLVAAALLAGLSATPAFGQVIMCTPVSNEVGIYASADTGDVHPEWEGSTIGLSWTLRLTGMEEGTDGMNYLVGNLIDPRGSVVTRGVYGSDMEWECDTPD